MVVGDLSSVVLAPTDCLPGEIVVWIWVIDRECRRPLKKMPPFEKKKNGYYYGRTSSMQCPQKKRAKRSTAPSYGEKNDLAKKALNIGLKDMVYLLSMVGISSSILNPSCQILPLVNFKIRVGRSYHSSSLAAFWAGKYWVMLTRFFKEICGGRNVQMFEGQNCIKLVSKSTILSPLDPISSLLWPNGIQMELLLLSGLRPFFTKFVHKRNKRWLTRLSCSVNAPSKGK